MDAGEKEDREQQQCELDHELKLKRWSIAKQKGFPRSLTVRKYLSIGMREVADDMYRTRQHDVAAYPMVARCFMSGHLPQLFDADLLRYESVLSSCAFCLDLSLDILILVWSCSTAYYDHFPFCIRTWSKRNNQTRTISIEEPWISPCWRKLNIKELIRLQNVLCISFWELQCYMWMAVRNTNQYIVHVLIRYKV